MIRETIKRMLRERNDDIYFKTLSEALEQVRQTVKDRGFEFIDSDSFWKFFATGGMKYGETKRDQIKIINKSTGKRKWVMVVIYRMDSGTYELTHYIDGSWEEEI